MSDLPSRLRYLVTELQRRRVLRVAAVYGTVAFGVVQLVDIAAPRLVPDWTVTLTLLLFLAGFPAAVTLAWCFDIIHDSGPAIGPASDAGVRPSDARAETATASEEAPAEARSTARWRHRTAFGVIAMVLVIGLFLLRATVTTAPALAPPAPPRIAVLYFDDRSPSADLGYLAAGLTEALIQELGDVGLDVISESGVRPYRGTAVTTDSLARALNVDYLITASVTRSGDLIRLRVHLTNARTGVEMPGDVITRRWGELFALQDDLLRQVADFLRVQLGREVDARQWKAGTRSVEAWRAVLESRGRVDAALTFPDLDAKLQALHEADTLLMRAHRLDRKWPVPLVERARVVEHEAFAEAEAGAPAEGLDNCLDRMRELADSARELGAGAEALQLRGESSYLRTLFGLAVEPDAWERSLASAERDLTDAVGADPKLAGALIRLAQIHFKRGEFEQAHAVAEQARLADSYLGASDVAQMLFATAFQLGHDREASSRCEDVARRLPEPAAGAGCRLQLMAWTDELAPDVDSAWALATGAGSTLARSQPMAYAHQVLTVAAVAARAGLPDSARAIERRLRQAVPRPRGGGRDDAALALALGDTAQALVLLRQILQERPTLQGFVRSSRLFRTLWSDPRFEALVGVQHVAP